MLLLVLLVAACASVSAFRQFGARVSGVRSCKVASLRMAQEPMEEFEDPKLFDMNKRVRLGRSRDQDGKSNIWSIEPRMEVEGSEDGEEAETGGGSKNFVIVGAVIGAALISLPLFQFFSTLVPDPADF